MTLDPKGAETLAEEFGRLVREYQEPDTDGNQVETWNLIADFAVGNADVIARAISTVTPAEVGGQRCDDALVSSISLLRALGRDDDVVHVAIAELEFVRSRLTAIEAQAAELAGAVERARMVLDAKNYWMDRAERSESALAEARKALEFYAERGTYLSRSGLDSLILTGGQEDG